MILEDLLYWFGDPMEGYLTLLQEGTWNIPLEDGTYYYKPVVVIDEPTANEPVETVQPQLIWLGTTLLIQAAEPLQCVKVYDLQGAQVADQQTNSTEVQIDGNGWGPGTYVIVITTASHRHIIQKIHL